LLGSSLLELGGPPGSPAIENTGALLEVNVDGNMSVVVDGLNLPTSMEIIGNTAYVSNMAGEVWKIDNISILPFGNSVRRMARRH
jgi:hypothetical protein